MPTTHNSTTFYFVFFHFFVPLCLICTFHKQETFLFLGTTNIHLLVKSIGRSITQPKEKMEGEGEGEKKGNKKLALPEQVYMAINIQITYLLNIIEVMHTCYTIASFLHINQHSYKKRSFITYYQTGKRNLTIKEKRLRLIVNCGCELKRHFF